MAYDEEYDVIVAGAGVGGLSAAITAAERGARVLVLEKFDKLGGVTALSSGQLWPGPNIVAEKLGITDSIEDAQIYMDHITQGLSNENLRIAYLAGCREAIKFFNETIDVDFEVIRGLPDYYYPQIAGSTPEGRYLESQPFPAKLLGEWSDKVLVSPYGPGWSYLTNNDWLDYQRGRVSLTDVIANHIKEDERCGGAGLSAALVYAALQRKVEFRVLTKVAKLVTDEEDRVIGVVAKQAAANAHPEKTSRIRAKQGVILAIGGYDWRKDLMKSFDGLSDTGTMVLPTITGDHIALASQVGAIPVPVRLPGQSPIFVGYRVPGEMIYGYPSSRQFYVGTPHSIIVNRSGQRFADDGFYPDIVLKVNQYEGQHVGMANWPAYLIFDQNMLDNYGLPPITPGQPLPEGLAEKANTLSELAKLVGIDAIKLDETVKRFNGFCETGVDTDFARGTVLWSALMFGDLKLPNPNLGPLVKAPFYVVELQHISLGATTAGLPIDSDGRVLDSAGTPVQGLYAAGNSTAWQDWGGGYNSGVAGMRGMLYGYRAALQLTET